MLTSSTKRDLKARAHALKPVVLLGKSGLTTAVLSSIDEALTAHELIKVRMPANERAERVLQTGQIAASLGADIVGSIGRVLILYRQRPA